DETDKELFESVLRNYSKNMDVEFNFIRINGQSFPQVNSKKCLYVFSSTSACRLEGFNSKLLNYLSKQTEGKALMISIIKVNNTRNVKSTFSSYDLNELKVNSFGKDGKRCVPRFIVKMDSSLHENCYQNNENEK